MMQAHALKQKQNTGRTVTLIEVTHPGQAAETLARLRKRAEQAEGGRPLRDALIVCTVMGGVLSEGVDYPGEMAVSATVVGPALPAPTFERQLMLEYHNKSGGQGFEYAFLYPGLNRVVQAAGRVIRSETDRGAIVLMGQRFAEPRYRELLPGYWQKEMELTDDAVAPFKTFWKTPRSPKGGS
jgi:Rad3-related DNA helicase